MIGLHGLTAICADNVINSLERSNNVTIKELENLENAALQHVSDYHNLRPAKPMETFPEDILWLISQVKKLRKEKKKNVKLLRTLAEPKKED
jgi:hypothetical protein